MEICFEAWIRSEEYQDKDLVKKIKKICERCRYLRNKAINIEMGPLSAHSFKIAPAFYATQVNLYGPLKSYSRHNNNNKK